ncbi:MAG: hypothetical protein WD068_01005 [Candidatus Babeliales bacterium]
MKHLFKSFLSIILLLTTAVAVATCGTGGCGSSGFSNGCSTACDAVDCDDNCTDNCCDDTIFCKTHFSPRSQGSDTARRLVGSHLYEHQFDMDKLYGTFAATFAYQRNFRTNELAAYFAPKCKPCDGCVVLGADSTNGIDVRSQDFGLSCTGKVCPSPRYSSFIADLQWWVGLSEWCPGTFFELYIPVVYTSVDYNCCPTLGKNVGDVCAETFPDNLMSVTTGSEKSNVGTTKLDDALRGNFVWGDVENPLNYGKQCCNNLSKTRVADLQFNLGYDFWQTENYHLGLKIIAKAPTGNVAEAKYLLEPIVGNGGHFELGGGLTASAILWDKDVDQQFSWHLEADITHLFNSRLQTRVFDLKNNGCYSRYLLLKKFGTDTNGEPTLDGLERGPNVFKSCVKIQAGAQVDLTSLWSYRYTCWNLDLAFNFWSRSQEKITNNKNCCQIPDKTYGIKGLLGMTGTQALQTASKATISDATDDDSNLPLSDDTTTFVGCQDLNLCSGLAPSALSYAAVGNITYLWEENDWQPYFGVGGKAEFSGKGNRALNQWAVWAKGGITF